MTKAQFLAKHKARFNKEGLPKSARTARYQSYLQGRGNNRGQKSRQKVNLNLMQNQALASQNRRAQPRIMSMPRKQKMRPGINPRGPRNFSDCALFYAQAVIDPWGVSDAPCIPDFYTVPSFKFGTRTRGTFVAGTMGFGYITADPYVVAGDVNCLAGTNVTFIGTFATTPGETGTNVARNNSPFSAVQFGATAMTYRLVGSGLAVRYVGNEMARGGQMIIYRQNFNTTFPNPLTVNIALQNPETTTVPIDREWHYVTFKPVEADDYDYSTTISGAFSLVILISGATAATAFEYDFVQWFEVIGGNVTNLTPSDSDPIGMAVIKSAMAVPQPPDSPKENFANFLDTALAIADSTLSFIGSGANAFLKGTALLTNIGLL